APCGAARRRASPSVLLAEGSVTSRATWLSVMTACQSTVKRLAPGRVVYASSSAQLSDWLEGWDVPPTPVRPLAINEVAPDVRVDGPAAALTAEIRELQRRFHRR